MNASTYRQSSPAQAGVTLLELIISTGVLAIMILMTLSFMAKAGQDMSNTTDTAFAEADVEGASDEILGKMRESALLQMTLFRYTEPVGATLELLDGTRVTGITQIALVFPTPRNTNDQYVVSSAGQLLSSAAWQGIVVYATFNETLCEYTDRTAHTYDDANPIGIASIDSTTITLTDGTTFPRDGTGLSKPGSGAARTFQKVLGNVVRTEVTIGAFPQSTSGFYNPGGFAFPIDFWSRDPTREDAATAAGLIPVRQLVQLYPRMRN